MITECRQSKGSRMLEEYSNTDKARNEVHSHNVMENPIQRVLEYNQADGCRVPENR